MSYKTEQTPYWLIRAGFVGACLWTWLVLGPPHDLAWPQDAPESGSAGTVAGDSLAGESAGELAVFDKPVPENLADLLAMQTRITELSKEVMRYTVGVRVGKAWGSGVIVSKDGYVLTAAHVAGSRGQPATFVLADGRRVPGRTLGLVRGSDAALMKISKRGEYPYAELGDPQQVDVGSWCIATGHPGGYQTERRPVVRLGRVVFAKGVVVQTDCTLVGGDSGGPLFGMDGRVIGIHSRIGVSTHFNLHVAASAYVAHWEEMAAEPYLGVQGVDDSDGTRLTAVMDGLAAHQAGLQAGDVIFRFGRKPVKNFEGLRRLIETREPGEEVTVEFHRGEEVLKQRVVLGKRPQAD